MTKEQNNRLFDFYRIPVLGRADSYVRGHYVDRYGFLHIYTGYDHFSFRPDKVTGELKPHKTDETVLHSVIAENGNLVAQVTYPDTPRGYWRINEPVPVEMTEAQKRAYLSPKVQKDGILPDFK